MDTPADLRSDAAVRRPSPLLPWLLLCAGCPGVEPDLQIKPVVPAWEQNAEPKVFSAVITDRQRRSITARVTYKRRAVGQDTEWSGEATRVGADTYEFTLPADHRPDTFLRTQTVDYRWDATARNNDGASEAASLWNTFQVGCADDGPAWWMAEQDRWVSSLDGLNPAELALRGYGPSHGPLAFRGLGLTFFKADPQFGEPDLLFYAPALGDMRLLGWGYATAFDSARWPTRGCIPFESWFVHEQGWHLVDGSFIPQPDGLMVPPAPGAIWHGRLWDVHLWRRDGEPPVISVFDDTVLPDGPVVPPGTFITVPWALP